MNDKKIYYLGFYGTENLKIRRNFALSAKTKMDYITAAITKSGYEVHIISSSYIIGTNYNFDNGKTIKTGNKTKVTFVSSFGTKTKIGGYIKIVFTLFCVFARLLTIESNQTLLVYHSPWLSIPVQWAKKIKKFRLVLEVEEIYADITSLGKSFDKMEYDLIALADAYLFSTDLLKNKVSIRKPSIVIYGSYNREKEFSTSFNDGIIHLLYAGVIDEKKAGAFNALEAAMFLSTNYRLHIIGFGDVESLKKRIAEINMVSKCKINYDGILTGNDYLYYCQKCHIGLATQRLEGEYLESSFPSKILSYLSMGLNVVSGRIESVEQSKVGDIITYYDQDSPQLIAKAIMTATLYSPNDLKDRISKLNSEFISDVNNIIKVE